MGVEPLGVGREGEEGMTRVTGDIYLHAQATKELRHLFEEINRAAWQAIRMLERHRPPAAERQAVAIALRLALGPLRQQVPDGWRSCKICNELWPIEQVAEGTEQEGRESVCKRCFKEFWAR